jgi:hypothetical protein
MCPIHITLLDFRVPGTVDVVSRLGDHRLADETLG